MAEWAADVVPQWTSTWADLQHLSDLTKRIKGVVYSRETRRRHIAANSLVDYLRTWMLWTFNQGAHDRQTLGGQAIARVPEQVR